MNRLLVLALLALSLVPSFSSAVEIKNIRPCWGPFGARRIDAKCLPGDVLFITYDIEGLEFDPKTKKASYVTTLELIEGDFKGKVIFKSPTENEVIPALGGTRMPGDLHVVMGPKQKPGKYTIKLTIDDKIAVKDKRISFFYEFEVLPEAFGFIHVGAQAVQFAGQHHVISCKMVNMALDAKTKQPDAELAIRILDENKKEVAEPLKMYLPKDIPEGTDLQIANVVAVNHPIYLNRVGNFTVEILAKDKTGKKTAEVRYPLTVLDISTFANK